MSETWSLTPEQIANLTLISVITSVISFVSALLVVFLYWWLKTERRFSFKLVMLLSLSDCLNDVGNFFGDPDSGPLCIPQAVLTSFFGLAAVVWTFVIALCQFLIVVRHISMDELAKKEGWFHVGVWGFCALMTALPLSTDSYGDAGAWCWLKNDAWGTLWRLVQFYLVLWSVFAVNLVLYLVVLRHISLSMQQLGGQVSASVRRMAAYPFLLLLAYSFSTVNRIQNFAAPGQPLYWLYVLHVVFAGSTGLFNALAYTTTPSVLTAIRSEFERVRLALLIRSSAAPQLTAEPLRQDL